tara:strand:- start:819 stop:2159 length:1341 start_codon:yes stop_codon:yes gene_type:complete
MTLCGNSSFNIEELNKGLSSIGIVGLGYVGLPLATLLATKYNVIGVDICLERITELEDGFDRTNEITDIRKLRSKNLKFTNDCALLKECSVIIVTVPTPIDIYKVPDLGPLEAASKTVGKNLKPGTLVVYESTVFPGLTEGKCCDWIEEESGLEYNRDFFLGYSPERVNPGDKTHTIDKIVKVVSGSTVEVRDFLEALYETVIPAGVHKAPNIATAEAAKIIENTQRDINIGLINELAMIFDKIGLDSLEVLEAARTKWNFLDFRPGMVGGHCIGVDPYYLTHLAKSIGCNPEMMTAGRRVNDQMGSFIAEKIVRLMSGGEGKTGGTSRVLILGAAFKENVPDMRNTRVLDLVEALRSFGVEVSVVDPLVDPGVFESEFGFPISTWEEVNAFDAVVYAVPHKIIKEEFCLPRVVEKLNTSSNLVVDIKGIYPKEQYEEFGLNVWRL